MYNKLHTVVVLSNVSYVDRRDMEGFENAIFADKIQFLETIKQSIDTEGVVLYSLCEFMDLVNNDEINTSDSWFGYIQLESMKGII